MGVSNSKESRAKELLLLTSGFVRNKYDDNAFPEGVTLSILLYHAILFANIKIQIVESQKKACNEYCVGCHRYYDKDSNEASTLMMAHSDPNTGCKFEINLKKYIGNIAYIALRIVDGDAVTPKGDYISFDPKWVNSHRNNQSIYAVANNCNSLNIFPASFQVETPSDCKQGFVLTIESSPYGTANGYYYVLARMRICPVIFVMIADRIGLEGYPSMLLRTKIKDKLQCSN
eukprot:1095341_1